MYSCFNFTFPNYDIDANNANINALDENVAKQCLKYDGLSLVLLDDDIKLAFEVFMKLKGGTCACRNDCFI